MPTDISSAAAAEDTTENDPGSQRKGSMERCRIRIIIFLAVVVVFQANLLVKQKVISVPQVFKETAVAESTTPNVSRPLPQPLPQPLPLSAMPTVLKSDTIMTGRKSPIVIAPYKLIFFFTPKIASSTWKRLFQRIRGIEGNSYIHNPTKSGLVYLTHYTPKQAQRMLASPEWTKAIWVRDPKERFLSAFLDKAYHKDFYMQRFCFRQKKNETAVDEAQSSLTGFFHITTTVCPDDGHWMPQHRKIDKKYWPVLAHSQNTWFVGHLENGQTDAKALLSRLYETNDALSTEPGFRPKDKQLNKMITDPFVPSPTNQSLWDRYCTSGGDKDGGTSTSPVAFFEATGDVRHPTGANTKLAQYYDEDTERAVEEYYAGDYNLQLLDLERKPIVYPTK